MCRARSDHTCENLSHVVFTIESELVALFSLKTQPASLQLAATIRSQLCWAT